MEILKIKNWEHWPSYMFYLPNIPYAAYLALRAKNLVFFSATNPAIKYSGNGCESKFLTLQLIPKAFRPISIFVEAKKNISETLSLLQKKNLEYPIIIKPNIGFRGLLVNKISSEKKLINYLKKHQNINLIIQEFVNYKNECGIFYYRLPNESKGKITSITLKKFLTIKGNGIETLKELILKNERAKLYLPLLTELHQENFNLILKKDEEKVLNVIGNHSKGTQFIDGNYLINDKLEIAINKITQQIPNWYYGRLDIKYNSFSDLLTLKNLKILEINGIISEPTHIYDPTTTTYFQALKEIRKHWKLIYKIAIMNHKIYKVSYSKIGDFLDSIHQLRKYTQQIKSES
jgi:hypothetical protein